MLTRITPGRDNNIHILHTWYNMIQISQYYTFLYYVRPLWPCRSLVIIGTQLNHIDDGYCTMYTTQYRYVLINKNMCILQYLAKSNLSHRYITKSHLYEQFKKKPF